MMSSHGVDATNFMNSKLVTPMRKILRSTAGVSIVLAIGMAAAEAQEYQVQEAVQKYQSGEARVTVECFTPAAAGKFPAVLLLHGSGGLEQATGDVFAAFARELASEGFVVLIPHYFEKTDHVVGSSFGDKEIPSYNDAVHDAIEFAILSGVVDSERIGVVGWSLGSYLAFFQSSKDPRIKALVTVSGQLPLESKAKFPAVLILQGSKDKGAPSDRLKFFQEKLKAENSPVVAHVYKGVGHNLDLPTWEDASRRTAAFFNKYLKKQAPRRTKTRSKATSAKT
jgi:carboxymethylenebutenolidase